MILGDTAYWFKHPWSNPRECEIIEANVGRFGVFHLVRIKFDGEVKSVRTDSVQTVEETARIMTNRLRMFT